MRPSLALLHRVDARRRAPSLAMALAIVAAMLLALLRLGVLPMREPEPEPNSFTLSPERDAGPARPSAAEAEARAGSAPEKAAEAKAAPDPPPPPPRPVDPPPVPIPATPSPPGMIVLEREDYASSDIGGLRSAGGGEAKGATGDSVAAYGPGEGPGGQRLYNAEWYREPTNAELAGYLPPGGAPAGSWALIACRTVERFEVENCRSLGESPRGSGLAQAMRRAAWQFRVRPPRVGGRAMVGEWVRIRISFGEE